MTSTMTITTTKPTVHHLPPTPLVPNSPFPLLHYHRILPSTSTPATRAATYDLHAANGWRVQWIFRYGRTQASHYHSRAHECMTVLSGRATIRFGVADTSSSSSSSDPGQVPAAAAAHEPGGVEVTAEPGDVFVVPAGVAHKTFDPEGGGEEEGERADLQLLTPGDGHGITAPGEGGAREQGRKVVEAVRVDSGDGGGGGGGFTMMGAYPEGAAEWDWVEAMDGGERERRRVWAVPRPARDPVLGDSEEGLVGLWKEGGG